MHNRFKPQSEFSQNVLTLMTGSTLSQAIPIAISPILTRIYTPEDFGLYAVYLAIITILGTIVSGRYELAIMLPKKDEDAINIFALGLVITICLTVLTTILVITFNDYIVNLSNNQKMKYWIYIIPVAVFACLSVDPSTFPKALKSTFESERFIPLHMVLVRKIPEAPTNAPLTIRAWFPRTKPVAAAAIPE